MQNGSYIVRDPSVLVPVFVVDVDSQKDVLLSVLPAASVHHHHVPHSVRPRTLQTYCLQGEHKGYYQVSSLTGHLLTQQNKGTIIAMTVVHGGRLK